MVTNIFTKHEDHDDDFTIEDFKTLLRKNEIDLDSCRCEFVLDYIDSLEKENDKLKHINSRLNGKSNILKEFFKDLINRI